MKVDQLDAQILIMCLYLSLSALHVSDSLVHHQERRFGAVYRNWCMPVRLAVRPYAPVYTNCDIHLQKTLVYLYTHCNMMHGAYNVKMINFLTLAGTEIYKNTSKY